MNRRLAGICVGLLIAALGVFAAVGLGAGGSRDGRATSLLTLKTPLRATAKAKVTYRKVALFGASGSLQNGDGTAPLGPCPKHTQAVSGSIAAQTGSDAPEITIHGSGALSTRKWFVDLNNGGTTIPVIATLLCAS